MPPLSELPGEISRHEFLHALRRLGFQIDEKGGDGSHCKITWPKTQKSVTIQQHLPKQVLKYILRQIEIASEVTWYQIKEKM
ncbi:MAG: type II toxin-antitoxin system HicA family toxin [Patescibacteria group bacterium]